MSQTQSLSRRYNHRHIKQSKNIKAPTIRLTSSQLLGSKMFSFEDSINHIGLGPFSRYQQHSQSQSQNNPAHKSQRKTQSMLSKKKNRSQSKNRNSSKNSTKMHTRLQSEATNTVKNEAFSNNDLTKIFERMSNVLQKYKGRQKQWNKKKQQYQMTIQSLLKKLKKHETKSKLY